MNRYATLATVAADVRLTNAKTLRREIRRALGLDPAADVAAEVALVEAIREVQAARRVNRPVQPSRAGRVLARQEGRRRHAAKSAAALRRMEWEMEAEAEAATNAAHAATLKRRVAVRLRRMGFALERSQGGSSYYWHAEADVTVRISDHDVPMTDRRFDAALDGCHTWADSARSLNVADASSIDAARWLVSIRRRLAQALAA